ncbi:MAG: DNA-directed RNA polymerase subunit A', partial [Nanoarchaeota archaeon]
MVDYVYKQIGSILFRMNSPEEAEKVSSVKVVTAELYDKEGYPVDGGLMDIRLGVIDPGLRCKTCGGKLKECMGHFGHIDLARPVMHVLYMDAVYDLLRGTCKGCYKILLDEANVEKFMTAFAIVDKDKNIDKRKRLSKMAHNKTKLIKKCPHCGEKQGTLKLEKPTTVMDGDRRLTPIEIREWLSKISERDAEILGLRGQFAKPEWMVLTNLSIPPVTMRPSITLETGERSEDDLTHKLGDIVRINQRLFENINAGAPEIIVEDLWDLLQYHVTTYFDSTLTSIPPARHRSGQPLKTLVERIKSKEGRFRHNLAGKRVNFAARTVISPDPMIDVNEVGVPQSVAMELTVPERVTEWNKEWLITLITNGPKVYPGANYVVSPDGKKKKITDETREQIVTDLAEGYVVERHLLDSDISIFNRQPSLHRMSIMSHRVKVLPGRSFRMNPSVCAPYNADFDGDEMNLHIPQTEEARVEAEILMQVPTQIISPKNGYNVIGCVEDSITGNYLLTKYLTLSKQEAVELLTSIGLDDITFAEQEVHGRDVISKLFPADFNFVGFNKKGEKYFTVKNGHLTMGFLDQNTIGESNGELLREFYRKYGPEPTLRLLDNLFRLGIKILLKYGFTTTIADTDISDDAREKIKTMIHTMYKDVDVLMADYKEKRLEALPGKTVRETFEVRILELLNKVRNKIGESVAEETDERNPTIVMARSGAKGSILNFTQMSSCVGQQALGGLRINKGYTDRCLSVFKKHDLGPEAHGFVKNSFKSGLTPVEFFFHAMTGRDALMDTALRTPKSGYLYRRLANALQDLKVEYDGTVRNASKKIIQYQYGEDGIDVSRSEGG